VVTSTFLHSIRWKAVNSFVADLVQCGRRFYVIEIMSMIRKINKKRMATQFKDRKYYLDICNKHILSNPGIDTSDWLIIEDMIKETKVMNALMDVGSPVVLKIGNKDNIYKEFNLSHELYVSNVPGFVKYICAFTCKDNLEQLSGRGFCNSKGSTEQHVLIMPYFIDGSVRMHRWNKQNFDILKSVIKQTIACVITAATRLGFHHNDLHLDNVMLVQSSKRLKAFSDLNIRIETLGYKPTIIDLELARQKPSTQQWEKLVCIDIRKMMYSLGDLVNSSIDVNGISDIVKQLDYLKDPFNDCNVKHIIEVINMVDKLTCSSKLM
jgi:serine/threonine protein kinase